MKTGIIYVLFDPREKEPRRRDRYVGKTTKSANIRLGEHVAEANTKRFNTHKCNWIRKLISEGVRPGIRILESSTEDVLCQLETKWIAHLREQKYKLTNGMAEKACREGVIQRQLNKN